jgi:cold shock CspA family protein
MEKIRNGKFLFFREREGFGFIRDIDSKHEYFAHRSALLEGFTPEPGDEVTFTIGPGRTHRPCAFQVKPICNGKDL